jgi:hypothetical protein
MFRAVRGARRRRAATTFDHLSDIRFCANGSLMRSRADHGGGFSGLEPSKRVP